MEPFDLPPEIFGQVPLFAEIAKAMSWTGGPVNWDIARQIATASARADATVPIISEDRAELIEATRVTHAWLEEATEISQGTVPPRVDVLAPSDWVERALGAYPEVIDPLAAKLTAAVPAGDDEQAALAKVLGQLVPLFLGIQVGSVVGGLARTVLTGYDLALPLEPEGTIAIVVSHVDAHARDYGIDRLQMRYWATLRAATVRTLFETLPWTSTHFFSLYHQYLAGVDLDLGDAVERLQHMDITSPEQLQEALGSGLFGLGNAPSAGPAIERLHFYLALVEATAARAVGQAAAGRLTDLGSIEESIARRRAQSDHLLERFLGLETPTDLVSAATNFVEQVLVVRGWNGLTSVWSEADSLPTADELRDPGAWLERRGD